MFGRFLTTVLVLILALMLAGCDAGEIDLTPGGATESPLPTEASLPGAEVVAEGEQLQYDEPGPEFLVLTTQEEWQSFWQTYLPGEEAAPPVDFAQSVVLVGIQGAKNTGGYDIRFTGLETSGDEVRVTVEMEEPDPSAAVEMVLTQPYVALEVDRDRLPSRESLTFVFDTEPGEEVGRVTAALAENRDLEPTGPKPTEPLPSAGELFAGAQVLAKGDQLRYEDPEPRFFVFTTQPELEGFWQTYQPAVRSVPQVDWTGAFVLAGIAGNKSTGGYDIRFVDFEQEGHEVRVVTELVTPPADQPAEMAFTQPYLVILVEAETLASRGALNFIFATPAGEALAELSATVD